MARLRIIFFAAALATKEHDYWIQCRYQDTSKHWWAGILQRNRPLPLQLVRTSWQTAKKQLLSNLVGAAKNQEDECFTNVGDTSC